MELNEIVKNNIEHKSIHKDCKEHELDEIRLIYRRCKKCGKFVVVADEDYLNKKGAIGRGDVKYRRGSSQKK